MAEVLLTMVHAGGGVRRLEVLKRIWPGFEPSEFSSRGTFEDFAHTLGPAVPAAAIVGDAVSGVAGTATQAVLRTLGTGRGR